MGCESLKGYLGHRTFVKAFVGLMSAGLGLLLTIPTEAATLDRVRQAGKLTLGYRVDAKPFSYQDASGKPVGYSVSLCESIADEIKTELNLPNLTVDWIPVAVQDRFAAVAQGKVDLLCAADTETISRRKEVSFSIGIFPGGIGAILRSDAPTALKEVLEGRLPSEPIWRGSPAPVLESKTFSVVKGTTSESWLSERLEQFQLAANVVPVANYDDGLRQLVKDGTDVFFGDRAILLDAAALSEFSGDLQVLDREFTIEPLALTLARNDDDLRLLVDGKLSRIFRSAGFRDLYAKWFGALDERAISFFLTVALPD
jgi:ABC-type amino acid transport substrate-binding protein